MDPGRLFNVATFHLFYDGWLIEVCTNETLISCCATMPICMAKAWRLYFLLSFVIWLCITHQRSHWLPQGDFVYLNDCLPAFMTVHQSISHFVSQSINQSRARQSVSKSLSCFINQSISWSVSHSIGCFVSQSVRQSFIMLVSQSGSQLSFS